MAAFDRQARAETRKNPTDTRMTDGERVGNILLVEGNPVDARLMQMLLVKLEGEALELQHVDCVRAAVDALSRQSFAAVLLDWVQPDGEGPVMVQRLHAASPDSPIIVLTNLANETLATEAIKAGAQDYLLKSDLNSRLLARALRNAMEHQRLVGELKQQAKALQSSETRPRILIDATPDPVVFKDGAGCWLEANAASLSLWQLDGVDYHGKTDTDLAEFSPFHRDAFLNGAASDEAVWKLGVSSVSEETLPMPGGGFKTYEVIKVPLFYDTASRFTRVNRAQAQTLNAADPQEAIGKSDLDFFAGDFYRATFHDEQVLFSTGQPIIGKIEELRWPAGRRWNAG